MASAEPILNKLFDELTGKVQTTNPLISSGNTRRVSYPIIDDLQPNTSSTYTFTFQGDGLIKVVNIQFANTIFLLTYTFTLNGSNIFDFFSTSSGTNQTSISFWNQMVILDVDRQFLKGQTLTVVVQNNDLVNDHTVRAYVTVEYEN